MTRKQALTELLQLEEQLRQLNEKRKSLYKIILAGEPDTELEESNNGIVINLSQVRSTGTTNNAVLKAIQENEKLTVKQIIDLVNDPTLNYGSVTQALNRLRMKGLVKSEKDVIGRVCWSLTTNNTDQVT